jgi:DNA-binding response OmpR family regulator
LPDWPVILIVADDEEAHEPVEDALTDAGFEPVIAESGDEAMSLLTSGAVGYRAVVIDIGSQSSINGWAIARQAREIDANFPIIYISETYAAQWASQGVPGSIMLQKPFARVQLLTALAQLLNASGAKL